MSETQETQTPTTAQAIEQKAAELSLKLNAKVHPILFSTQEGEEVVGYIRELNRADKLRVMDSSLTGAFSVCAAMLEAYIVKEESDPRIWSDTGDDKYYIGAVNELYGLVRMAVNQFKKK